MGGEEVLFFLTFTSSFFLNVEFVITSNILKKIYVNTGYMHKSLAIWANPAKLIANATGISV